MTVKTVKTRKLSDVPSELLMQALEDLELVLADPFYRINMITWYDPVPVGSWGTITHCDVCHAGAVIAKSLGNGPMPKAPSSYGDTTMAKLCAINEFRVGDWASAFDYLGKNLPVCLPAFYRLVDDEGVPSTLKTTEEGIALKSPVDASNHIQTDKYAREFYFNYFQDLIGILQAEGL